MNNGIGGLEQGVSTSAAIRYPPELKAATIYAFRPEQRWLVTDDWVEALKRIDSLDGKTGAPPVPHLAAVRWYNYHMPNQGIGYPRPNPDSSLSEAQQQYITAVEWVHRLAQEIDPRDINNFPIDEAAERHDSTLTFVREHDPEFLDALDTTSKLLEQVDPETHNLRFTLTEEAYQELDSPKKKLAAFLLIRTRVSGLVPGVIEELRAVHEVAEVTDLRELYKVTRGAGEIRPVVDTFLTAPMGEGRTTLDFLQEIYIDPLITNTTSVFVGDTNHVRERFIAQAKRVIQAEIARENALMPPPELPDLDRVRLLAHTQRALEAELAQLSDPTDRQVNLASQRILLEAIATLPIPEDLADSVRQTRRSLTHVQESLDAVKELEAGRSEPLTSARRRRLQREIQLSTARRRVLDFSATEDKSIYNANKGDGYNVADGAVNALSSGGRLSMDHREVVQKFSNLLERFLDQATPDGITQLVQAFDQLPEEEREKLFQSRLASGSH